MSAILSYESSDNAYIAQLLDDEINNSSSRGTQYFYHEQLAVDIPEQEAVILLLVFVDLSPAGKERASVDQLDGRDELTVLTPVSFRPEVSWR